MGAVQHQTRISVRPTIWLTRIPGKLKELQDAFDVEAKKYNVYPLDSSFASRVRSGNPAEPYARAQRIHLLSGNDPYPGRVCAGLQEQVVDDSCRDHDPGQGVQAGSWQQSEAASGVGVTYARQQTSIQSYALSNQPEHKFRIASDQPSRGGQSRRAFSFKYDGGGIGKGATGTLFVREQVAQGRIPQTVAARFLP